MLALALQAPPNTIAITTTQAVIALLVGIVTLVVASFAAGKLLKGQENQHSLLSNNLSDLRDRQSKSETFERASAIVQADSARRFEIIDATLEEHDSLIEQIRRRAHELGNLIASANTKHELLVKDVELLQRDEERRDGNDRRQS